MGVLELSDGKFRAPFHQDRDVLQAVLATSFPSSKMEVKRYPAPRSRRDFTFQHKALRQAVYPVLVRLATRRRTGSRPAARVLKARPCSCLSGVATVMVVRVSLPAFSNNYSLATLAARRDASSVFSHPASYARILSNAGRHVDLLHSISQWSAGDPIRGYGQENMHQYLLT